MREFITYLVCMWFGAGVGCFAMALLLKASDRWDDDYRND